MTRSITARLSDIFRFLFDDQAGRFICIICSLFGIADGLYRAIQLQNTGSIPSAHGIYLVWWHWSLPFAVSRIWDPFTMPLLAIMMGCIATSRLLADEDGSLATLSICFPTISLFTGLVFGVIYVPVTFILLTVMLVCIVVICICFSILYGIWNLWRERRENQIRKLEEE